MYTRVVIIVRDVDDNCPSFTTPSQITTRYSSPIKTDTIVGRVQLADSDSQYNHVLSVTDSTNFKIDSNGNIRTARILESLVQLNYSFNVTATNSRCTVISQVALTLEVHPTPMTYMFTDNGNYEETVFENKGVVSKFTIVPRIQGNYSPVAYSIVETTSMFAINSNSGKKVNIEISNVYNVYAVNQHKCSNYLGRLLLVSFLDFLYKLVQSRFEFSWVFLGKHLILLNFKLH